MIKFDFEELCNKNLGSEDYITIANNSDFIFIENLPNFNENNSDQQQRFITLIDEFYDRKVKMIFLAAAAIDNLYSGKKLAFEFKRTISRLKEMQSYEYLSKSVNK